MKHPYKRAFTLIGMGIGFGLWYFYDSVWPFLASIFLFMGIGTLLDARAGKSD